MRDGEDNGDDIDDNGDADSDEYKEKDDDMMVIIIHVQSLLLHTYNHLNLTKNI